MRKLEEEVGPQMATDMSRQKRGFTGVVHLPDRAKVPHNGAGRLSDATVRQAAGLSMQRRALQFVDERRYRQCHCTNVRGRSDAPGPTVDGSDMVKRGLALPDWS